MSYINEYAFFENLEKTWRKVVTEEKERELIPPLQTSLKFG